MAHKAAIPGVEGTVWQQGTYQIGTKMVDGIEVIFHHFFKPF